MLANDVWRDTGRLGLKAQEMKPSHEKTWAIEQLRSENGEGVRGKCSWWKPRMLWCEGKRHVAMGISTWALLEISRLLVEPSFEVILQKWWIMAETNQKIGERLAALRRARGLTLQELAERCGLSASFLSQIERGVSAPSIVSLYRVCQALSVPLFQVLPDPVAGRSPVRYLEMQPHFKPSEKGTSYVCLSGNFPGRQLEILINLFPPGYQHPKASHKGEEFGYVLSGDLTLIVEDEEYLLGPGDSFHFVAEKPHTYRTRQGAKVLIVSTEKFLGEEG